MTDYTTSTSGGTAGGRSRTVTAFFDSRSDADRAIQALVDEGVDRERIRFMPGSERDADSAGATTQSFPEHGRSGFWESLADLFLPDRDRDVYAEGLNRGGFLVAVETTDANHDAVVDILDDEGTIDMDEREDSWRAGGWSGSTAGQAGRDSDTLSRSGDIASDGTTGSRLSAGSTAGSDLGVTGSAATRDFGGADVPRTAGSASLGASTTTGGSDLATGSDDTLSRGSASETGAFASGYRDTGSAPRREGSEEVIPIVEEQLNVGKREVDRGRVRVRSFVREVPAHADVTLRDETVRIERRPVDRPLGTGDEAFQDRTIDVQERTEEPVISKEARVREEVVVNRDVSERTQSVDDTVKRTEVEVDDDRAARGTGAGSGTWDKDRR